jgi:hypothetical protein
MTTATITYILFGLGVLLIMVIATFAAINFLRVRFKGDLTGTIISIAGALALLCAVITIAAFITVRTTSSTPETTIFSDLL